MDLTAAIFEMCVHKTATVGPSWAVQPLGQYRDHPTGEHNKLLLLHLHGGGRLGLGAVEGSATTATLCQVQVLEDDPQVVVRDLRSAGMVSSCSGFVLWL